MVVLHSQWICISGERVGGIRKHWYPWSHLPIKKADFGPPKMKKDTTMNRTVLSTYIFEEAGLTKKQADRVLESIMANIAERVTDLYPVGGSFPGLRI